MAKCKCGKRADIKTKDQYLCADCWIRYVFPFFKNEMRIKK